VQRKTSRADRSIDYTDRKTLRTVGHAPRREATDVGARRSLGVDFYFPLKFPEN